MKYSQAAVKEDVFNILREAHLATGHGKELVMYMTVSRAYFNVSRVIFAILCNECAICLLTRSNVKKIKTCHRLILINGSGSRGQVDLVELQNNKYEGMKLVMAYCDHGTTFAATCYVPNKQVKNPSLAFLCCNVAIDIECIGHAPTIAKALLDIFNFIAPLANLQLDNGREFHCIAKK